MQVSDWLLTPHRLAIHLPTMTAVVADLHLGYGEARQRNGEAVPARSLSDQLTALGRAVQEHNVHCLVIAGDLFEDGRFATDTAEALHEWLKQNELDLAAIVPGNHDRGLDATRWPLHLNGFELGRWRVVHGDGALPEGPVVQGHLHPCVRWLGVTAPCYLYGGQHLTLPAYSADAAGVNLLRERYCTTERCYAIVGERVLDFGSIADLRRKCRG
jgi:putative SbcD/Mre11-related phosphoesterase